MKIELIIVTMLAGTAFGWRFGCDMHRRAPRTMWPLGIAYILVFVAILVMAVPGGWLGAVAAGAGWIAGLTIAEDAEIRKRERLQLEEDLSSIAAEGGIVDADGNAVDPADIRVMTPEQERRARRQR